MTNPPKVQLLMVGSHSSLPGLETPLSTRRLNTRPGPAVQHVLVKQVRGGWQGSPWRHEDGDVQGDISNLAL